MQGGWVLYPFTLIYKLVQSYIEFIKYLSQILLFNDYYLMHKELENCTSYEEWKAVAAKYQKNKIEWKKNPKSPYYDYELIKTRVNHIAMLQRSRNLSEIFFFLRAGLVRNLGGIQHQKLHDEIAGTKELIEEYLTGVTFLLKRMDHDQFEEMTVSMKQNFFHDALKTLGRTALFLSGGAALAMMHFGVVKALVEGNVMPQIVCGTSVGSIIACLAGVYTDAELKHRLEDKVFDLSPFEGLPSGSLQRKISRFIRHGYLLDVHVLEETVQLNVGDISFQEAFKKTNRILNIVVYPSRKNQVPMILNYLTAPDVLIWSAASASCAVPGLYESCKLYVKDSLGNITVWEPSADVQWGDTTSLLYDELPIERLTGLFNVNHFIVSQVNPYVIPFVMLKYGSGCFTLKLLESEVKHRYYQLKQLNLIPSLIVQLVNRIQGITWGDETIVPWLSLYDVMHLFSNPTRESLRHFMLKGQRSTWPLIGKIRSQCVIENAIFSCLEKSLKKNGGYKDMMELMDVDLKKKRNKSFH